MPKSSIPQVKIVNAETSEKIATRDAVLAKLDLTADELKALLG